MIKYIIVPALVKSVHNFLQLFGGEDVSSSFISMFLIIYLYYYFMIVNVVIVYTVALKLNWDFS